MSDDPKQQQHKTKIIGFRVTEDELQNIIYPVMHDCHELGIIDHDTVTSFLRFCVQFWMGHYRMKKQQFAMSQREIDEEKKKLAAIIAEKEAWQKWDNSAPRVMEKAVKELEQMGEEFERDSKREIQQQRQRAKPKQQQQQQSSASPLANLSLEDMMA
jgi:flagellar biosynthesis GTPase FlhF